MKKYINPTNELWTELIQRPTLKAQDLSDTVKQVFDEVKRNGDKAVEKYTHFFAIIINSLLSGVNLDLSKEPQTSISLNPTSLAICLNSSAE